MGDCSRPSKTSLKPACLLYVRPRRIAGRDGVYCTACLTPWRRRSKHVPMIAWLGTLGARTGLNQACLSKTLDQPLSRTTTCSHTVMVDGCHFSSLQTNTLDAFASCRTFSQPLTASAKKKPAGCTIGGLSAQPHPTRPEEPRRASPWCAFQQVEQLVHHHGHGSHHDQPAGQAHLHGRPAETSR